MASILHIKLEATDLGISMLITTQNIGVEIGFMPHEYGGIGEIIRGRCTTIKVNVSRDHPPISELPPGANNEQF